MGKVKTDSANVSTRLKEPYQTQQNVSLGISNMWVFLYFLCQYYLLLHLILLQKRNILTFFSNQLSRYFTTLPLIAGAHQSENHNVHKKIKLQCMSSSMYFQDAHEFLGQVLDQLKEEVDKLNKDISNIRGDANSKSNGKTVEEIQPNPTTKNFEFEVLHTITCTE